MAIRTNPDQAILPGVVMTLCQCGCGQYFMAAKTPRERLYMNKAHKKRAQRQRDKARRTDATVKMAPKGYLYLYASENHEISALWDAMGPSERAVIMALCETGLSPTDLLRTLSDLFNQGVF